MKSTQFEASKWLFVIILFLGINTIQTAQELKSSYEAKYSESNPNLPNWVKMMYADNPNIKDVMQAYDDYYEDNEFEKNTYTQFYKRWLRDKWIHLDKDGFYSPPTLKIQEQQKDNYLALVDENATKSSFVANWEELGPWEYDHEAAMNLSVQSPGSAHVYTVEQSVTNPDVVYAGTANAGIWKSTDKGITWDLMTKDYYLTEVYSIEIDNTDEDIVYFHAAGRIWKTINGGAVWAETGGGQYFSWTRDIKMLPTNNQVLLAATTSGMFRTADGGASWTMVAGGHYQEIEFHPTQSNIVYAVKSISGRTEFYKSTDSGLTFTLKPTGWPGIASTVTTESFSDFEIDNSTHITLDNVELGSATAPNFTIEMRVKSSGWSGDPAIISNKNWASGGNKGFIIAANGSGWKFNIGDGNSRIDLNGSTLNDNEWHYLAVTYEAAGDKKLYQDGVLVNSTTDNITTNVATGLNLGIGQDGTLGYGFNFEGSIAEVRVWNTALSASDIEDNHCQSIDNTHPSYASLLHHWKMNEGSGTVINDSKGTNNGLVNGTATWNTGNDMVCIQSEFSSGDEQGRTEIAVSADAPNTVYALATGEANGGAGLYGFYKSIDSGENFTFTCCDGGPGGVATVDNPNIVGYSYDFTGSGGQFYYDLSLGVSPIDAERVMSAGISVARSEDGGSNWTTNGHWVTWVGSNTKQRYTHADVHDVKFFQNGTNVDMWVASDGGLYYSSDQGDNIEPRMHGIQGTEFWGFGASYKEDAMVGGTYHNGTLVHFEDEYNKGKDGKGGWFAGGAGDATRGHVSDVNGRVMFEEGGMFEVVNRQVYFKWLPFDNTKRVNQNRPGKYGNYEWHPWNQNIFYTPTGSELWKTEDNGANWSLIHDFGNGLIYNIRIPLTDPNIIYVTHEDDVAGIVKVWKSIDEGATWTNITPSDATVGGNNYKSKTLDIDQDNPDNIWLLLNGGGTGNKVFKSINGGTSWFDWTGSVIASESTLDIVHHQGTDGGVYIGSYNSVFYRNNSHSDWQLYSTGLPVVVHANYLHPYYTEGKIRVGTYRGAYQSDLFENAAPTVRISVDKTEGGCTRDVFKFKDLSYVQHDNVSWSWTFDGGTPATSNLENPEVTFTEGSHTVSLTVTNDYGSDTQTLTDLITIENGCNPETIPGNALSVTGSNSSYARAETSNDINFGATTDFTITTWIKTATTSSDAVIIAKKDWDSGANPGWVLATQNGKIWMNVGDGSNRIDIVPNQLINDNEWHYIAVSCTRNENTIVYLDGVEVGSQDMSAVGNIDNTLDMVIGADSEFDYPVSGLVDEICIFNAALSQEEIREQRHLTKPFETTSLVSYFQFNEVAGEILDRKSTNHLTMSNAATRMTSTCPVGGGTSHRMDVVGAGSHVFTDTDVTMNFPSAGTYPDGELVVSRLNLAPDFIPYTLQEEVYFVVNNYGANSTFSGLENIHFANIGNITELQATTPGTYKLYKRDSNEDADTWGSTIHIGGADTANSGSNGSLSFSAGNNITSFSQFVITQESTVLPVAWLRFNLQSTTDETVLLDWKVGEELGVEKYEIERSRDGSNFERIGVDISKKSSDENSVYQAIDAKPLKGLSYYRLKEIDLDGNFYYSPIRSILFLQAPREIVLYPNPISKGEDLTINTLFEEQLIFELFDAKGKNILSERVQGNASISTKNLASGIYFFEIRGEDRKTTGKIIISER